MPARNADGEKHLCTALNREARRFQWHGGQIVDGYVLYNGNRFDRTPRWSTCQRLSDSSWTTSRSLQADEKTSHDIDPACGRDNGISVACSARFDHDIPLAVLNGGRGVGARSQGTCFEYVVAYVPLFLEMSCAWGLLMSSQIVVCRGHVNERHLGNYGDY